jgi:hypothetical protein
MSAMYHTVDAGRSMILCLSSMILICMDYIMIHVLILRYCMNMDYHHLNTQSLVSFLIVSVAALEILFLL